MDHHFGRAHLGSEQNKWRSNFLNGTPPVLAKWTFTVRHNLNESCGNPELTHPGLHTLPPLNIPLSGQPWVGGYPGSPIGGRHQGFEVSHFLRTRMDHLVFVRSPSVLGGQRKPIRGWTGIFRASSRGLPNRRRRTLVRFGPPVLGRVGVHS